MVHRLPRCFRLKLAMGIGRSVSVCRNEITFSVHRLPVVDSGQTYNDHYNSPHNSDYQRRWLSEQEMNLRSRNHRINASHSQGQHPTQTDLVPASIAAPPDFHRPNSLQTSYARPSSEITTDMSNWNNWDVDNEAQLQRYNGGASTWPDPLNLQIPQFTHQQFNNMLYSASDTTSTSLYSSNHDQATLNGFSFPQRFSPASSPSPSPVFYDTVKQDSSVGSSASHGSRRNSLDRSEPGKSCSHCHAKTTPLWRRDPSTMKPLCNACGLYLQQRNKLRPQELIDADDDGSTSDESDANYVGPECSHCRTHHTSVWRRSKAGEQLCNACGVYARLRGKPRPLSLKRNKIRPRSKHLPKWISYSSYPSRNVRSTV
jgi:GATA zinc finger